MAEGIIDSVNELLRGPPPYDHNPDERNQGLGELYAMIDILNSYVKSLVVEAENMGKEVVNALENGVEEVTFRLTFLAWNLDRMKGLKSTILEREA